MAGELTARSPSRAVPLSKQAVAYWESHGRVEALEVRRAYATLMANMLSAERGEVVGVRIRPAWRVEVFLQCERCGRWHRLATLRQRRFRGCRRATTVATASLTRANT
jgi:hypothetical protein